MKRRPATRKLLALTLLILGLGVTIGTGFKYYQSHKMVALAQTLQKAKDIRSAQMENAEPAPDAGVPAKQDPSTEDPALVRVAGKTRQQASPSACTEIYQKYIENRPFAEALPVALEDIVGFTDSDLEENPCAQQLTDVIDPERIVELTKKCEFDDDADKKAKEACMTLFTLGWTAFAETEFRDVEPSEIPPDALHAKIGFRLVDLETFLKKAEPADKEYLYRLMDQMHTLRPDIDYGTTREELVAEFYKRDRRAWKDDYRRILEGLEATDMARAVYTYYEAHDRKMDRAFLDYVDGLAKRKPESAVIHIFKGFAHTGVGEWDEAAKALAEGERLGPGKNSRLIKDLRASIQTKKPGMSTYSWRTVTLDMPGA